MFGYKVFAKSRFNEQMFANASSQVRKFAREFARGPSRAQGGIESYEPIEPRLMFTILK